jgi:hypothetical protein|tara:strand:- start:78 stop:296 length:219 start_codon:yes stop_codon:yes gene_type:complete
MAVTEKRINNIEETLIRQDEQVARIFSDLTDIKKSQHKMSLGQNKMQFILIGLAGGFVLSTLGLLETIKIVT